VGGVILKIIWRRILNATLRIAVANLRMAAWGVSVKPGLDGLAGDVRKPQDSNGEADNMIGGRENGQPHLDLTNVTAAHCRSSTLL
jgi:hypothetical protein